MNNTRDLKAFKKQMGRVDPSYKYMSDADLRGDYQKYLANRQNEANVGMNADAAVSGIGDASELKEVVVTDIDIPMSSMVKFMVKWSLASVPAFILLFLIFSLLVAIMRGLLAGH